MGPTRRCFLYHSFVLFFLNIGDRALCRLQIEERYFSPDPVLYQTSPSFNDSPGPKLMNTFLTVGAAGGVLPEVLSEARSILPFTPTIIPSIRDILSLTGNKLFNSQINLPTPSLASECYCDQSNNLVSNLPFAPGVISFTPPQITNELSSEPYSYVPYNIPRTYSLVSEPTALTTSPVATLLTTEINTISFVQAPSDSNGPFAFEQCPTSATNNPTDFNTIPPSSIPPSTITPISPNFSPSTAQNTYSSVINPFALPYSNAETSPFILNNSGRPPITVFSGPEISPTPLLSPESISYLSNTPCKSFDYIQQRFEDDDQDYSWQTINLGPQIEIEIETEINTVISNKDDSKISNNDLLLPYNLEITLPILATPVPIAVPMEAPIVPALPQLPPIIIQNSKPKSNTLNTLLLGLLLTGGRRNNNNNCCNYKPTCIPCPIAT